MHFRLRGGQPGHDYQGFTAMLDSHQDYFDRTPSRDISLRSFMTTFKDIRSGERMLGYWTGEILPYLQSHPARDKRQLSARLKKATVSEVSSIINEVLEEVSQPFQSCHFYSIDDTENNKSLLCPAQTHWSAPS